MISNRTADFKRVVRAALDPITVPTEPVIVQLLEKMLCQCKLGSNCYIVFNVYGEEREVPYNASVEQWTKICQELLDSALAQTNSDEP